MLSRLDPPDVDFLTRISMLDALHAGLCNAVAGSADAAERLVRLARDTPVFVTAEGDQWLRMHSVACEALRARFAALPAGEQAALHARAADWLAEQGLLELAAGHALAAGQRDRAYELAERSLYESLMTRGHQGSVLEWLARLPPDEVDRRPRLLLAAAWSLALSERHDEAGRLVARILAQPEVDASLQCECAQILSGAAVFADDPDRFFALYDRWIEAPPLRDPLLLKIHVNRLAFRLLLEGDPAQARLREQQSLPGAAQPALAYVSRWGDFIVGLSYLWEGQVLLAEKQCARRWRRPRPSSAPQRLRHDARRAARRRGVERDQPAEATALLANRLDARTQRPARGGAAGYRTVARAAAAQGGEPALDAGRCTPGVSRRLPRLSIASPPTRWLHARRFRPETCRELCAASMLLADPSMPAGPAAAQRRAAARNGLGHAAIAAQDWRQALELLTRCHDGAARQAGRPHTEPACAPTRSTAAASAGAALRQRPTGAHLRLLRGSTMPTRRWRLGAAGAGRPAAGGADRWPRRCAPAPCLTRRGCARSPAWR